MSAPSRLLSAAFSSVSTVARTELVRDVLPAELVEVRDALAAEVVVAL